MKFYTMFYVNNDAVGKENLAVNGKVSITGYIKCCETLDYSLARYGFKLIILTNNANELKKHLTRDVEVIQIEFQLDVPPGIRFYSAHFKLDTYKWLGENASEYSLLIDSDVLCINHPPKCLTSIASNNIPIYYDLTDQVFPAYGEEKIISDKEQLMQHKSVGNWSGGELIGGDKLFFSSLYNQCMKFWSHYKLHYSKLHHQGDEMITSCAIETLMANGYFILDAGKHGILARYWSVKTRHIGLPIAALKNHFLLHLPADKDVIPKFQRISSEQFIAKYLTRKPWFIHYPRKVVRRLQTKLR